MHTQAQWFCDDDDDDNESKEPNEIICILLRMCFGINNDKYFRMDRNDRFLSNLNIKSDYGKVPFFVLIYFIKFDIKTHFSQLAKYQ